MMPADLASFLSTIRSGDLDACAVLADWLEEQGDPRGKRLRTRWRRWKNTRERNVQQARLMRQVAEQQIDVAIGNLILQGYQVSAARDLVVIVGDPERENAVLLAYVNRLFPEVKQ